MANEWNAVTVGDIFDLVNGYAFKSADFINSGVPVIKIKNVKAGEFSEHEFSYVTEDFLRTRANKLAKFGDLLISMSGNRHDGSPETWVGKVAQFRKTGSYFINQRVGALRVKEGARVDSKFASYVLSSFPYQELFIAIATSSGGQANLSPAQILSAPMRYPSLHEQRAIAHILGTLDDKIELNRKQNETLEAMARALFKAWFVDFEPVRAKMEGRWQRGQSLPGMPAHIYDFFPDRLVESELGEIPEGWEMRSLDSIANYLNGLALQKFPPESKTEFLPVIKIAQLRAGNTNGADKASTQIKPEYVVVDGDVLFSWSGSLEVEVWNGGRGALNQHLFKVTSNEVPKWFYFFATRQHLSDFRAIAAGKATTMGHIQRKHLTDARIAVAPPESMKKFDAVIASLFDQLVNNAQQSRSLAQLRDTLLPKLISGELRVLDAERIVGVAV
jgi:type I restriction enzyme, S subunit